MVDRSKIIDRIRKLLALSSSNNQHEAELAAQRASEMLEQHQLSMSDVEVRDIERSRVIKEEYVVGGQKMKLLWITQLARAAARLFDGEVLSYRKLHGTSFAFIGFPDDVAMMKPMFEHLYNAWFGIVEADLRAAKMEHGGRWEPCDTMLFKAGHGKAYANALQCRCHDLAAERKRRVSGTAPGTALVLVKDVAIKNFGVADGWVHVKTHQSTGSESGRRYGRAAGESVALGGALANGNATRIGNDS